MPCEKHQVAIYDRGGMTKFLDVAPLESVEWGRISSDISTCTVVVRGSDCEADLSKVQGGRHEMVVFRGGQRVWEGPITDPVTEGDTITLIAKDVLHYTEGTVLWADYDNSGKAGTPTRSIKSIDRAKNIITAEMGRQWEKIDPPANVVPFLLAIYSDDDLKTSTKTLKYERTVYDDLEALASRSSLEYTTVGRRIVLFDSDHALSRTPTLTEQDIAGNPQLTQYGSQVFAWAVAVGNSEGDSVYAGTASGKYGFPDPYYGAWETIVESSADEDGGDGDATRTELSNLAKKHLKDRIPAPIELVVPDGVTLAANSALYNVDLLVPGVLVPVRAQFLTRVVTRTQKLTAVTWKEDENGETVTISLVSTEATLLETP